MRGQESGREGGLELNKLKNKKKNAMGENRLIKLYFV